MLASFQTGGLAARIIPVNGQRFDIVPIEPLPVGQSDAVRAIMSLSETVNGDFDGHKKITIGFADEGLSKAKGWFAALSPMAEKKTDEAEAVSTLESKILIQSAKLAGVLAIASLDKFSDKVDANQWLKVAYPFVGYSHIANLDHISEMTEQGQILAKLRRLFNRKGPMTQRDVAKFASMKPSEVYGYLRMMVAAGEVRQISGNRCGVVKYVLAK
jgi:hypothetical protein